MGISYCLDFLRSFFQRKKGAKCDWTTTIYAKQQLYFFIIKYGYICSVSNSSSIIQVHVFCNHCKKYLKYRVFWTITQELKFARYAV